MQFILTVTLQLRNTQIHNFMKKNCFQSIYFQLEPSVSLALKKTIIQYKYKMIDMKSSTINIVSFFAKGVTSLQKSLLLTTLLIVSCLWSIGQTTVNYVEQDTYFNGTGSTGFFTSSTSGHFNQNSHQMGLYAHGGGTQQVLGWRQFKTAGNVTGGTTRSLQIGDVFQISFSNCQVYGEIGFSLLSSPSARSSWSDRLNNDAISINLDGPAYTGSSYGSWYAKYYNGTTANASTTTGSNLISASGTSGTYKNFTITCTLTAANLMNVSITDGSTTTNMYDLLLNNSNPITDYCVYLDNDWDGGANRNAYVSTSSSSDPDYVQNAGSLPIGNSNSTFTISNAILNGYAANSTSTLSSNLLSKSGSGTLTLSGANTFTGGINISAGTLKVGAGSPNFPLNLNNVTMAGGTLDCNGWSPTIGSLSGTTGTITIGGAFLNTLYISSSSSTSYGGTIINGSGTMSISKAGTGGLTLSGLNTYTGGTTINNGTIFLGAAGNGTNSPLGTTATGTTVNSGGALDIAGYTLSIAHPLTIYGTGYLGFGALTNSVNTPSTYSGPVTLGAAASIYSSQGALTLTGGITTGGYQLTLDGTIGGLLSTTAITGTGSIYKTNTGTWTLSAANSYSGLTTINNGTLFLGGAGSGSNSPLGTTASGTVVNSGGALDLSGYTLATAEPLTINGTGSSVLPAGALTNSSSTAVSYSGLVTLGSAATITANNGVLSLSNTGTITGSGYGLTLSGSTGGSIASIIGTGTGTLTKNGTGTWTLSGANTYTGATSVSAGSLFINGSTNSSSAFTVSSNTTVGGNGTINGTVALSGNVAPGNAAATVGTLTTGAFTFNNSAGYNFDITNVAGSAGTNWDLLSVSTINFSSSPTVTIYISGNPTGFSTCNSYSWTIASASTSISNFGTASFVVNTSSFSPTFGGTFAIQQSGNNINLVYTGTNVTPAVSIALTSGSNPTCSGSSLTFTATATNISGGTVTYNFKNAGSTVQSSSSNTYTTSSLSNGDVITCDISISGGTCLTSSTATCSNNVTMSISGTPTTSNAGTNQSICLGNTATLAANNPSTGTGTWSISSGPSTSTSQFSSTTAYNATFTPSGGAGSYVLVWTISNSPCTASTSSVTITFSGTPTTSVAGSNQSICTSGNATLAANNPSTGTGTWSISSGPSTSTSQFSSTTAYNATFTPSGGAGSYVLVWTISNSPCTASTSSVTITVNASVGGTAASTTACLGGTASVVLSGNTGTIQWYRSEDNSTFSSISGATSSTYNTPNLNIKTYYRATVMNGSCASANSTVSTVTIPEAQQSNDGSGTYSSTWSNGQNDGTTGMGAWVMATQGGGGFYPSGSSGVNNGQGKSWGMYAGGTGTGNAASATRTVTVGIGSTIGFSMANNSITNSDTIGFGLLNASGQNLMQFYFIGGATNYSLGDGTGTNTSTGVGYTTAGLDVAISYTSATGYSISITPKGGSSTTITSRSFFSPAGGQLPTQIRFFNTGAGSGSSFDLFFNSLTISNPVITTQPSTSTQNVAVGASATSLTVAASGTISGYQWYSNGTASNSGGTSLGSGSGAQTASYTPSTASAGTTYYYCVVTGTCGSTTSNVSGAVIVSTGPVITSVSSSLPSSSTTQTYAGATITVTGTNLSGVTTIKLGGSGGTSITTSSPTTISGTSITFVVPDGTSNGTVYISDASSNTSTSSASFTNLGYISTASTDWNTGSTWLGSNVPSASTNVTIANAVTVTGSVTNAAATVTINSGGTLAFSSSAALTASTVTNNGTLTMSAGTLTLASSGTLTNNTNGTSFIGGTVSFSGTGSVGATYPITFNNFLSISGVVNLNTAPTINGTLTINTLGGVGTNSPYYGSSSTLFYNASTTTISPYHRSYEWALNTTSIASAGYPNNVIIGSSSVGCVLDVDNYGTLQLGGSLTIGVAATYNSSLQMNEPTVPYALTVIGSVTVNATGTLLLGNLVGAYKGDLFVKGDFTNNGTLNTNNRGVFFAGTTSQTISGTALNTSSGASNNFPYLIISNTSAAVTLGSNVTVSNTLTINSGATLADGGNTLTLTGNSIVNNGTHSGTGKVKLTASSDVTLTGTGTYQNLENALTSANLIVGASFNIAGNLTNTSGGIRGSNATLTFTGNSGTLTNNSAMYGEFSGSTLSLTFNGSTTLAGSTGYLDAKNYTVGSSGTLICAGIGLNTNSTSPSAGTVTINGILQTSNSNGLWNGTDNTTTIRYCSGNFGTITLGGASTIVYNYAGAQKISGPVGIFSAGYYNLTCTNTALKQCKEMQRLVEP